ncbi:MAG: cupredoxin domain-containing protein [Ardenticatenaceae bacterium]
MKQIRFFFFTALVALFLAASTLVTSAASHENVQISALDFEFAPQAVTITAGHTVTWTNDGNAPHTVTGSDDSWDSGTMSSGDTYSFTFNEPGTYQYYCRFHGTADGSGMAAVITVEAGDEGEESEMPEVMPSIMVEDQTVSGGQVMIAEVVAAQDGWLVIHNTDAEGNVIVPDIISEPVMVSAGTTTNVMVTLTEDVPDNHVLVAMLHIDDGEMGVYEFPDADPPALAGEDLVVAIFTVMVESAEVMPSIMVEDQMISGRQVMIAEVVAAQDGWLVIHNTDAEGNVIVPDIISEPVMVSAGTTTNVMVTLTEDVPNNHVLVAMLHIDDGEMGVYEFPDADPPALAGEDLVIAIFTVMVESAEVMPSIMVEDQTVSGRQVMIAEVVAAQDGWLVIHNTDAEGNVIVPDIISEPVMVSAGTTTNVMVTLTEDVPNNHVLVAMLHIDDGEMGVYEFPDADPPALAGEDLVVAAFTVMVSQVESMPVETRPATPSQEQTDLIKNIFTKFKNRP